MKNRRMRKLKEEGITLIALVVTIIVLLILAAVTINFALSNNGLIKRAKDSVTENERATILERIKLSVTDASLDDSTDDTGIMYLSEAKLNKALTNEFGAGNYSLKQSGDGWIISVKGVKYHTTQGENIEDDIDWDEKFESATKHDEQENSDDIGLDSKGNPVNLDYWIYNKTWDNDGYLLGTAWSTQAGVSYENGYKGPIEEGKIKGEIPQYIKESNGEDYLPVTDMSGTFNYRTDIIEIPAIPNTVKNMIETFEGCTNLEKVAKISTNLKDAERTFYKCSSLLEAPTLPNGVTNMWRTFQGCSKIKKAPKIPDSVTNLTYTFGDCESLEEAPSLPAGITELIGTFFNCKKIEKAPVIPTSVTRMGKHHTALSGTFYGCESLKEVGKLPSGLTDVSYAFCFCTSLKNVDLVIPNNVEWMQWTFNECVSLSGKIEINSKITSTAHWEAQYFFDNAASNEGASLVVTGTCPVLDEIIATKTEKSNITKGN